MSLDRLRHVQMMAYSSARYWLGRRWSPAGRLALAALAASAVLGFDTAQSMAFQAFTLLVALLAVALISNRRFRPQVEISRRAPRLASVGEPLSYSLRVVSRAMEPLRGLKLFEDFEDPRPTFAEYLGLKELPGENWLERITGYGRWLKLVARRRIAAEQERDLPELAPGKSAEIALELVPARRGVLRLRSTTLARRDALGLSNALARVPSASSVLVLPKRYPAPRLALSGARRYQQGGVTLSSDVGDSQEFMSLRDYRPGDPPRRIHWRSWAKTGSPVVKEYEDEYFVRHALVLDTFAGPGQEAAFEEAVSVAASFSCSLLTQESLLDLLFIADRAYCFTAGRGLGGPELLLEALACAQACGDKPFGELGASVAARRHDVSAALIILLGCDDQRRALIRSLRASGMTIAAAAVASERDLPDAFCAREGVFRLEPGRIAEGLAAMEGAA